MKYGLVTVLGALIAACDCGAAVDVSGAEAEITATSPVVADGARASLVTVRLSSDGEPVAGASIEIITDRGDDDEIEQPEGPTDEQGVVTGRIRSTVPGTVIVRVEAEGRPMNGSAEVVFIPLGDCMPGDEEECYEGSDGTLGVGRCSSGLRVCNEWAEWGECEGQVLPADIDGVPCNGEDDNCDGTIDTHMDRASPDSCGWCGNVCPVYANAERICDSETGACSMGECHPGYWDLDEDPETGCWYACEGDPEVDEICDGTDTNCDGRIDGGPGGLFDVDGDGFSICGTDFEHGGTDTALVDCDDLDADVHPGAPLLCDGKDNDCDEVIDSPDEACDTGLSCLIGRCEVDHCVSDPLDCSHLDGVCLVGVCEEQAGGCVASAEVREDEACDMGDGCSGTCRGGLCWGCECDLAEQCEYTFDCGVALCEDGRCSYRAESDICDAFVCGVGSCDPGTLLCSYDLVALEGEICELGGCQGICLSGGCDGCDCEDDLECDDGVECTVGTCQDFVCSHQPNDALCDDGDVCTGEALCDPIEGCIADQPLVCDDSDECTSNLCDPVDGCYFPPRAPSADSAVHMTSDCLVPGAGGQATVYVDLRDEAGLVFEGVTVDFQVTGTPVGWVDTAVVESAVVPGIYHRTLLAPSSGTATTISVQASGCNQSVLLDQVVTLVYEDALPGDRAETGGCSPGGGNLRVRAIDEDGSPLAGAFVMVGDSENPSSFHTDFESFLSGSVPSEMNTAATDAQGYAVFYDAGLGLPGAGILTAGAEDRAYVSLVAVEASEVVLVLPITSPPSQSVTITGNVSGTGYPGADNVVGMGLVSPVVDLDVLLNFDLGNLFEDDTSATFYGTVFGSVTCDGVLPAPANIHLPNQCIATFIGCACSITSGIDPWTLRPYQSTDPMDIFVLHATAVATDLEGATSMADLVSLLTFRNVALRSDVTRSADAAGQDLTISHPLTATMPATVSDAPQGDLYLLSVSDLDGLDGLGRLMIQGMNITSDATSASGTLTTHAADGVFAGKRDFAMALSLVESGGYSLELDRMTTGRNTDRSFDSMFGAPVATVGPRSASWSGVIRPGISPESYQFSKSVFRRDSPRGQYKIHSEPFWIVYAASGVDGFALPDLPVWAPRSAQGGFLIADGNADQVNRLSVSLPHLGLLPDPAGFDLGRLVLGSEIEWLTHVAGALVELP